MRVRRLAPWIAGLVTLLLLIATLLIGWMVRRSMRAVTEQSINSVLAANVKAIDLWLTERKDDATRLVDDDAIREPAQALLAALDGVSDCTAQQLKERESAALLRASRLSQLNQRKYIGWGIIDSTGRVLASSHESLLSKSLPIDRDTQEKLDRSLATVSRPFRSPVALEKDGPLSLPGAPLMISVAPMTEGVRSIGGLALFIDPLEKFTEILQVAGIGATGETYAFDQTGLLLSRSRFESQLRASGMLSEDQFVASALNIQLRDPGSSIVGRKVNQRDLANRPLTLMADQATRGATGSNVVGYNDYRGIKVVGTWRWLADYGFGVATEMDHAEAYGPMSILRNSFFLLVGVVALASFGLFTLASVLRWYADNGPNADPTRRLGQYNLGSLVGEGGMGAVYHGRHEVLRRDVAVKVLEHSEVTPRTLSRFEREVRMTAKLRHPNTIDIYDYGHTEEGTFFYVMEYIDGMTLLDVVMEHGRQPPERVIYLLLQVCGSLSEAHGQMLVHRDIKPANILITSQAGLHDMVKVLDFGLVKDSSHETIAVTQTSSITGTPLYMSPEAVRDASSVDARSDIYSLGAVGYHLLTGLPIFDGENPADVCVKQLHQDPQRPDERSQVELPDDLQNVLMACLRKDPAERPQSIDDLAQSLLQCEHAHHWTAAEACRWWQDNFQSPRDVASDFANNGRTDSGLMATPKEL